MHTTITGVDLAKKEIQVCVCKHNKVLSNQAMTPTQFASWLDRPLFWFQKQTLISFFSKSTPVIVLCMLDSKYFCVSAEIVMQRFELGESNYLKGEQKRWRRDLVFCVCAFCRQSRNCPAPVFNHVISTQKVLGVLAKLI